MWTPAPAACHLYCGTSPHVWHLCLHYFDQVMHLVLLLSLGSIRNAEPSSGLGKGTAKAVSVRLPGK